MRDKTILQPATRQFSIEAVPPELQPTNPHLERMQKARETYEASRAAALRQGTPPEKKIAAWRDYNAGLSEYVLGGGPIEDPEAAHNALFAYAQDLENQAVAPADPYRAIDRAGLQKKAADVRELGKYMNTNKYRPGATINDPYLAHMSTDVYWPPADTPPPPTANK
jgi:hypothetical protein